MSNLFGESRSGESAASPPADPVAGYAQVALERGIDTAAGGGGLTYAVPAALEAEEPLAIGQRVIVPLGRGNRPAQGYVVARSSLPPKGAGAAGKIKRILSRAGEAVALPESLVELARWLAGYYCCPLGMVFGSMLPSAVARGAGWSTRQEVRAAANRDAGEAVAPRLPPGQARVLGVAREAGDWLEVRELADRAGCRTRSPVQQLITKGWLEKREVRQVASDLDLRASEAGGSQEPLRLSVNQQAAVEHVTRHAGRYGVHLLHGVTGSGKTEVYLQTIAALRSRTRGAGEAEGAGGGGVIVLVPEIALTPQTVGRFLSRFEGVAVLHSGLTAAQRHAQWRRIAEGEAQIVVGARSAIFAPVRDLALIIVDEEHESSYKQDQLPRYHARDVAIKRAHMLGIPVLLGSATPSLESYARARQGGPHHHLLRLPERAAGMKLPKVEIIDLAEERRSRRGVHLLSQRLEQAIARVVDPNQPAGPGQAMLLLNRRGYANYIACPDHRCGWMMHCDHCDTTMVYHLSGPRSSTHGLPPGFVRCHHCGAEQMLPQTCPDSGHKVTVFGLGTQRVEEELHKKFPHLRIARMDADTMRSARDYQQILDRFRQGEFDLLLGTQMIAKGLDFERVRLVGVISADTSLHLPDFRASERTFQLVAQVAGRAGRGDQPGRVVVQTFSPEDPAITDAARHDYESFAERELAVRAEVGLPPAARMARVVIRHTDWTQCQQRAEVLGQGLERLNASGSVRLRGPMPCPIARVADHHRLQIELLAPDAAVLQRLLTAARNEKLLISDQYLAVDVDPVSLL